jgi:predicted small secreted protein
MKLNPRIILLLALLGLEALIVSGCANTGRGLKRDFNHNVDEVKDELKH